MTDSESAGPPPSDATAPPAAPPSPSVGLVALFPNCDQETGGQTDRRADRSRPTKYPSLTDVRSEEACASHVLAIGVVLVVGSHSYSSPTYFSLRSRNRHKDVSRSKKKYSGVLSKTTRKMPCDTSHRQGFHTKAACPLW